MITLPLLIGLITFFYGIFYVTKHKKKLPDDHLEDYKRSIRPKVFILLMLSFIPLLSIGAYIYSVQTNYHIRYFAYSGLAIILVNVFAYLQAYSIIKRSEKGEHFQYSLSYFVYIGTAQLFFLLALANSLTEFIES